MKVSLGLLAVTAILAIAFLVGNAENATVHLPGTNLVMSTGAILLTGYAAGLLAGLSPFMSRLKKEKQADKTLEKWEQQDVKLAASVQSDREKQLEAKIATLEAALQRALKK